MHAVEISTSFACKIQYIIRDKNEKSHLRVVIDLGLDSDHQNSHANWTFQLCIPSYVYDYCITIEKCMASTSSVNSFLHDN